MKTLKDKINESVFDVANKDFSDGISESFFDNIEASGKERLFLYDLKNNLDKWKTSADADSLIDILNRFCHKAQEENFKFVIYIGSDSADSVIFSQFYYKYYETPGTEDTSIKKNRYYNRCWQTNYIPKSMLNSKDTFNPPVNSSNRKYLDTIPEYCNFITNYVNRYKKDVTIKVRMSLDNPKSAGWV